MSKNKLKSCPFCNSNGNRLFIEHVYNDEGEIVATRICCMGCNAKGATSGKGIAHAEYKWNSRISEVSDIWK